MAVAAVTFSTSFCCNTKGAVSNSVVAFADIALVLKRLNTASDVSVIVTVIVSAFPESSDTNIDFTIAVAASGTVYSIVQKLNTTFQQDLKDEAEAEAYYFG